MLCIMLMVVLNAAYHWSQIWLFWDGFKRRIVLTRCKFRLTSCHCDKGDVNVTNVPSLGLRLLYCYKSGIIITFITWLLQTSLKCDEGEITVTNVSYSDKHLHKCDKRDVTVTKVTVIITLKGLPLMGLSNILMDSSYWGRCYKTFLIRHWCWG